MKDVIIAVLAVSCILALIAIWIQHKLLKTYVALFDCLTPNPVRFAIHSMGMAGWFQDQVSIFSKHEGHQWRGFTTEQK